MTEMKKCCEEYMCEQFGGDADLMAEIYGEYVASVTAKIAEAKAALAAQDRTTLDRIAHTIKGNALAVGDAEMAETAIALRKTAALGDDDASAKLIAQLETFKGQL